MRRKGSSSTSARGRRGRRGRAYIDSLQAPERVVDGKCATAGVASLGLCVCVCVCVCVCAECRYVNEESRVLM